MASALFNFRTKIIFACMVVCTVGALFYAFVMQKPQVDSIADICPGGLSKECLFGESKRISEEEPSPARKARISIDIALTKFSLGDIDGAHQHLVEAAEISEKLQGNRPLVTEISAAFADIGEFGNAIDSLYLIREGSHRTEAMIDLSENFYNAGQAELAVQTLSAAIINVSKPPSLTRRKTFTPLSDGRLDRVSQSFDAAEVVKTLANIELFESAERAISEMRSAGSVSSGSINHLLRHLAREYIRRGRYKDAENLANGTDTNLRVRADILIELLEPLSSREDEDKVQTIIANTIETIDGLGDPDGETEYRIDLAEELYKLGHVKEGAELLSNASRSLNEMHDTHRAEIYLQRIAVVYGRFGDVENARNHLAELTNPKSRHYALLSIATNPELNGVSDNATWAFPEALLTTKEIKGEEALESALELHAIRLGQVGRFEEALDLIAGDIQQSETRDDALASLSKLFLERGNLEQSEIFGNQIEDMTARMGIFEKISAHYVATGNTNKAERATGPNWTDKARVLIVAAYAEGKMFEAAQKHIDSITSSYDREEAIAELAKGLALDVQSEAAYELAAGLTNSILKVKVLMTIAKKLSSSS